MTFLYPYPYFSYYPYYLSYLYYPDYNPFLGYPYSYGYRYEPSYSYGSPSVVYVQPPYDETAPSGTAATSMTPMEWLRQQLRVEPGQGNQYQVEWIGSVQGVRRVVFRAVDAAGKVLSTQTVTERPFRGSLSVPPETQAVTVDVETLDGPGMVFRIPVADFRALVSR